MNQQQCWCKFLPFSVESNFYGDLGFEKDCGPRCFNVLWTSSTRVTNLEAVASLLFMKTTAICKKSQIWSFLRATFFKDFPFILYPARIQLYHIEIQLFPCYIPALLLISFLVVQTRGWHCHWLRHLLILEHMPRSCLKTFFVVRELPRTLVTFDTFDQSDGGDMTWPKQDKDKDI